MLLFVVFPACKKWSLQSKSNILRFSAISVSPNNNLVLVGLNLTSYGNRNSNLWFFSVFPGKHLICLPFGCSLHKLSIIHNQAFKLENSNLALLATSKEQTDRYSPSSYRHNYWKEGIKPSFAGLKGKGSQKRSPNSFQSKCMPTAPNTDLWSQ